MINIKNRGRTSSSNRTAAYFSNPVTLSMLRLLPVIILQELYNGLRLMQDTSRSDWCKGRAVGHLLCTILNLLDDTSYSSHLLGKEIYTN